MCFDFYHEAGGGPSIERHFYLLMQRDLFSNCKKKLLSSLKSQFNSSISCEDANNYLSCLYTADNYTLENVNIKCNNKMDMW